MTPGIPKARAPIGDVLDGHKFLVRSVFGNLIVLDDVERGQLSQGGEVDSREEFFPIGCPISKKANSHILCLPIFQGEPDPSR